MIRIRAFCFLAIVFSVHTFATQNETFGEDSIRICTYNIRYASPRDGDDIWINRKESVAKFLSDFDVMGLQEVTANQFEDLRERLPEFSSYGLGRDDGRLGGESAAVFFRRDRFVPLAQGTIWLGEDPTAVGQKSWDAAMPRTMTWMVLRDQETSGVFVFANTHFDHVGKLARQRSGELIADFLSNRFDSLPTILLGDFNCLPGSPPHAAISNAFRDVHQIKSVAPQGPDSTWCGFKEIVLGRRIDHVFINNQLVLDSVSVLDPKTPSGRFASDHLPVTALVRLKK